MKSILAKSGLALALGATALASAAPAQAQRYDRYRSHHRGGDATGAVIVGGILGLGIGAAIASSSNRDRSYDDRYAYRGDVYERYPQPNYYQDYRSDPYAYRAYDGYDRAPVCTVQRTWDRYAGRTVTVRVCR